MGFCLRIEREDDEFRKNVGHLFPRNIQKALEWISGKKIIDEDENIEEHYNVYVYKVLLYPPRTKNVKDSYKTTKLE